jgi:hypothetical protein
MLAPLIDIDDAHWHPTDPPYQVPRKLSEKKEIVLSQLNKKCTYVVAGDLSGWGEELSYSITVGIYLFCKSSVRLLRIKERELIRFGEKIETGGQMHERHIAFLNWAAEYEDRIGCDDRSYSRDLNWMKNMQAPYAHFSTADTPLWKVCCQAIQFVGETIYA